jgi:hypothetical protein
MTTTGKENVETDQTNQTNEPTMIHRMVSFVHQQQLGQSHPVPRGDHTFSQNPQQIVLSLLEPEKCENIHVHISLVVLATSLPVPYLVAVVAFLCPHQVVVVQMIDSTHMIDYWMTRNFEFDENIPCILRHVLMTTTCVPITLSNVPSIPILTLPGQMHTSQ